MKVFRDIDTTPRPADSKSFVGPATTRLLASGEDGETVHLYRVVFESGGRTNWHTHSGPQWLFVIEGRIRAQRWGDAATDLTVGDVVCFAPGEKHWHGAVPGSRGSHLAMNVNVTTDWLEPVAEEAYNPDAPHQN